MQQGVSDFFFEEFLQEKRPLSDISDLIVNKIELDSVTLL
jgi:hypothetical protein